MLNTPHEILLNFALLYGLWSNGWGSKLGPQNPCNFVVACLL